MVHRSLISLCISIALAISTISLQAETLTYPDLVHRLTDMGHLATLPPDGEKGGLASSYDRGSKYDAATDKYIRWDANGDGSGIIREEDGGQVLADIQGAGCIWRIWSATPLDGHIRIYLDGSTTPAVDLPFAKYFSQDGPFGAWPNIVYIRAGNKDYCPGSNNYIPIPFQKSCKIVGDKGTSVPNSNWGNYYHFTYTLFAPGTVVSTFKLPLSSEDSAALTEANQILGKCGEDPAPRPNETNKTATITVAPGQTATALDLDGASAITVLKIKTPLPESAEAQRNLLRQLTIRMTWDGAKEPAVWSPLGDFFGYLGGGENFTTQATGLLEDGTFYSHWYMPFASSAKIELGNDSPSPVTFSIQAHVAPLESPIANLGRFHAKWHRDIFNPERKDRFPDWTLVTTQGKGRFVGTMLHAWNPGATWWGEGDEKFFVDGEKFPSYFGTGSEDFFGYAWGNPTRFFRPFHAQPLNENNVGHVDDLRWLISENVPFHTTFEGDIEKYFGNGPSREDSVYAAIAYWYLSADGKDPYGEVPAADRFGYWKRTASYREPGVIEAESLDVASTPTASTARMEDMWGAWPGPDKAKAGIWSGDMQLTWDSALHDELDLKLPIEKMGTYKVIIRPTKAPTYGIFQFGIDGQPLGAPIDLYSKDLAAGDPVEIGTLQLPAGKHLFNITNTGRNAAITDNKPSGFGLDYVKLVPAP